MAVRKKKFRPGSSSTPSGMCGLSWLIDVPRFTTFFYLYICRLCGWGGAGGGGGLEQQSGFVVDLSPPFSMSMQFRVCRRGSCYPKLTVSVWRMRRTSSACIRFMVVALAIILLFFWSWIKKRFPE